MSLGLDPMTMMAMQASLAGTMTPEGVMTQQEAQNQAQLDAMAARSAEAAQQAAAAGQQFQQAQAAPAQTQPFMDLAQRLGGGVASVLTRDPSYHQQAEVSVRESQQNLVRQRNENLEALQRIYDTKAKIAEQAGDLETAEKARIARERLANQLERARTKEARDHAFQLEKTRQDNRLALRREIVKGQKDVAQEKAAGDKLSEEEAQAWVDDLSEGRTNETTIPREFRNQIKSLQHSQGKRTMPPKVRTALDEMANADGVVDILENLHSQIATAKGGYDRWLVGGKEAFEGWLQKEGKEAVTAYLSTRQGMAGNLSRAISAERGVLTEQDRGFAIALTPSLYDTGPNAELKFLILRNFINRRKLNAVGAYTGTNLEIMADLEKEREELRARAAKSGVKIGAEPPMPNSLQRNAPQRPVAGAQPTAKADALAKPKTNKYDVEGLADDLLDEMGLNQEMQDLEDANDPEVLNAPAQ